MIMLTSLTLKTKGLGVAGQKLKTTQLFVNFCSREDPPHSLYSI